MIKSNKLDKTMTISSVTTLKNSNNTPRQSNKIMTQNNIKKYICNYYKCQFI